MMRRVPREAVLRTEYPFCTGNACFLHRMPLKMRRVPQEPVLSTECVFRTVGGPLRYRMPQSQKGEEHLPAASITNTKKEKSIACNECHNCQKRGFPPDPKRRPVRKAQPASSGKNKKRTTSKSFSFQFGVRCGARTHDTQNHNLVLYQLN